MACTTSPTRAGTLGSLTATGDPDSTMVLRLVLHLAQLSNTLTACTMDSRSTVQAGQWPT